MLQRRESEITGCSLLDGVMRQKSHMNVAGTVVLPTPQRMALGILMKSNSLQRRSYIYCAWRYADIAVVNIRHVSCRIIILM